MVEAAPAPIPTGSARVPASTIRAIRRFHALDQQQFAECFQVAVRTVIRWEQKGIDPALLDGKWRKDLLFWMLGRYERAGSPDNRPKEGIDHVSPSSR